MALGERLVYEERAGRHAALTENVLRVSALRRLGYNAQALALAERELLLKLAGREETPRGGS